MDSEPVGATVPTTPILVLLGLYLIVGVEVACRAMPAPSLRIEWCWLLLAPVFALVGARHGLRRPTVVWTIVALSWTALAIVSIHATVARASVMGARNGQMPAATAVVIVAAALLIAWAVWKFSPNVLLALVLSVLILAIVWPGAIRGRAQSPATACKSNLKNIGTALEMYSTDNTGRFPVTLDLLTPNYLKTIPTCPNAGCDTYSFGYESASSPDAYTVCCFGINHTEVNYSAIYTSTDGLLELHGSNPCAPDLRLLHVVRLDESAFAQVRLLLVLAALAALLHRGLRPVAIGLLLFALAPWDSLVASDRDAVTAHNRAMMQRIKLEFHR